MKTLGFLFLCVGFALVHGQDIGRQIPQGDSCNADEFKCDVWRRDVNAAPLSGCIPESWRCDGIADCESAEDENPTTCEADSQASCTGGRTYFDCGKLGDVSGVCVTNGGVCDAVQHCGGTDKDEKCWKGPNSSQCKNVGTNNYMTCPSNGRCVPQSVRCDGYRHCAKLGIVSDDEEDCFHSRDDVCGTATPFTASQAGGWTMAVETDRGYYSNYLDCSKQFVNLDPPQTIRITFIKLDTERGVDTTDCVKTDQLSIEDGTIATPVSVCGYSSEPFYLDFHGEQVNLTFSSDARFEFTGFEISLDVVCKDETFTGQTGSTRTPFYGARLPLNMDCTKVVNLNTAVVIKVSGNDFGEGDGMEITDANGNTYSTSFGACGNILQGPITIRFWSDDVDTSNTGASVSWTAVGQITSANSELNGACQHGAKCDNGACVCKKPWGGEYCENKIVTANANANANANATAKAKKNANP